MPVLKKKFRAFLGGEFFKKSSLVTLRVALDVFIILCFAIVFAALVEFAMLNFLDTLVRKMKRKESARLTVNVSANTFFFSLKVRRHFFTILIL
jgi:hypothetical protein